MQLDKQIKKDKIKLIYNICVDELIEKQVKEQVNEFPQSEFLLLACGRLTKQKGFEHIINAMPEIITRYEAVHLMLIGEGEDRGKLKKLITKLNLDGHISMPGFCHNPYPYFREADVFILSSLWEGFGNVVVEAMYCETPVVATNCNYGPNEIIDRPGENGILVEVSSTSQIAGAVIQLLDDKQLRLDMAIAGKGRSLAFEAKNITREYFRTFRNLLQ